jgi:tripartite-type tricarboxylate transporter receptor subunit TctC
MSGAGGLTALNTMVQVQPKDGTVMDVVPPSLALVQVLGQPGLQYDARALNWIGRLTSITQVFYTWERSQTKTLADLKTRETLIGGTGPAADSTVFSNLLNGLVGTRFKVIQGYNETAATMLAMERGEIDGTLRPWEGMKSGQERGWIAEGKINMVAQYGTPRHPELPNVGSVYELATNDGQRRILDLFLASTRIGRALAMGPGIPPERVQAVQTAFAAMLKDPAFMADAEKLNMAVTPASGDELAAITAATFKVTPEEIAIAKKYYH